MNKSNQQLLDDYLLVVSQSQPKNSINTIKSSLRLISHFNYKTVTSQELLAWRNDYASTRKSATVNNRLILIKAFFTYLHENNFRKNNPATLLKLIKEEKGKDDEYKIMEVDVFKQINEDESISKLNKCMMGLAFMCGLRISEISSLNVEDIDFDNNEITVRLSKGKKTRYVPLPNSLKQSILDYIAEEKIPQEGSLLRSRLGKGFSPRQLSKRFMDIRVKYGIEDEVKFHSLRHSYLTKLANSGTVSLTVIMDIAGHNSLQTSKRYIHRDRAENSRQVLSVMDNL